jgi:hypothetical protein
MIIATFGPSTGWSGKTITREADAFILEGHGPITAADIMEYDRQGQLVWASEGMRAWVGGRVGSGAKIDVATPPQRGVAASSDEPSASRSATVTISRRTLIILGGVALAVVAVLVLALVLPRFGGGAASSTASENPQRVKVMTMSGPYSDYFGQSGRQTSAAFEFKGTEQEVEAVLDGEGRLDVWLVSTAGPDSGHSDPSVVHIGPSGTTTVYKEPGRYTLEVIAGGDPWTVSIYDLQ